MSKNLSLRAQRERHQKPSRRALILRALERTNRGPPVLPISQRRLKTQHFSCCFDDAGHVYSDCCCSPLIVGAKCTHQSGSDFHGYRIDSVDKTGRRITIRPESGESPLILFHRSSKRKEDGTRRQCIWTLKDSKQARLSKAFKCSDGWSFGQFDLK